MSYVGRYGRGGVELPGRTFVAGLYYPPMLMGQEGAAAATQDREYAMRFEVGVATTFDRIAVEVTTNAASAVVRLGVRADSGNCYPSTLVLDAGTVDASSTGFKTITISQALAPGRYWVTATLQVATGVSWRARPSDPFIGYTSGSSVSGSSYYQDSVTGALPASFSGTVSVQNVSSPKVMLRAA